MRLSTIVTALIFAFTCLAHSSQNGNGKVITGLKFELTDKHPFHDEILNMIQNADIPVRLREAIIDDFRVTSINNSSEAINYGDLQKSVRWELSSKKSEIKKVNGVVVEEKETESYSPVVRDSVLGLHISYVGSTGGLKVPEIEKLPVAAISLANPVQVIYFSTNIKPLPKDEVLKLVIHEQAHRLKEVFGPRSEDERFVEGWTEAFYKYLKGELSSERFQTLLRQNTLERIWKPELTGRCTGAQCFPNERMVQGQERARFESQISVILKYDDIVTMTLAGPTTAMLIVKKSVFKDYPPMTVIPEVKIYAELGEQPDKKYQDLLQYVQALQNKTEPAIIPLSVTYEKVLEEKEGVHSVKYGNVGVSMRDQTAQEAEKILKEGIGQASLAVTLQNSFGIAPTLDQRFHTRILEEASNIVTAIKETKLKFWKIGVIVTDTTPSIVGAGTNELNFNINPSTPSIDWKRAISHASALTNDKKSIFELAEAEQIELVDSSLEETTALAGEISSETAKQFFSALRPIVKKFNSASTVPLRVRLTKNNVRQTQVTWNFETEPVLTLSHDPFAKLNYYLIHEHLFRQNSVKIDMKNDRCNYSYDSYLLYRERKIDNYNKEVIPSTVTRVEASAQINQNTMCGNSRAVLKAYGKQD
jgi:hypothetical protein